MPKEVYQSLESTEDEKKLSYITVPIEVPVAKIEAQINGQFKGLIYDDNSFDKDDLKLKIWKQKDLNFSARPQGIFEFSVPLKIWVEKRVSVLGFSQSASTEFEIIAKFSSKPFISNDWKLKTVTNAEGFSWVSQPALKVGGINLPITALVGTVLKNYQGTIARMIDESITNYVDIQTPVLDLWNKLKTPTLVNTEYNIWTQIEPQDILMTELITTAEQITTRIAIKALINSSVGQISGKPQVSATLPPLKYVNNLPEGFDIHLYNLVTFKEAQRIVNELFNGQSYSFAGGRTIQVTGVKIYGGENNKLVIQIETVGDLNGTIYLKGDAEYDETSRKVVLSKTKFDLKTSDLLKRVAAWMLQGNLERKIEKEFGIPVDPIFEMAKNSVNEMLKSTSNSEIKLKGGITEITPRGVKLQPEGLLTVVEIKGNIEVKL